MSTSDRRHLDPVGWVFRTAWGRRLETGVTLAITVARVILVHLVGRTTGLSVLAVLVVAFVFYCPTRTWLVDFTRKERLERTCTRAFAGAGIEASDAPAVLGAHPTPSGMVVNLGLSPRLTATDLAARSEPLAVAFGAASARVRQDAAMAGRAQLVLSYRDPLAEGPVHWPWTGIARTQLWSGLPLGIDEDDALVTLDLAGHHLLLGGESGAGKSNALSLVVAAAALDPATELWCFDGKLVELAQWRRCCRRFVGADVAEASGVLCELRAEMEDRYRWMLERGLRKVDQGTGCGLVIVVIDELALYLQGKSKARDELAEVLRDLVARGRAAGIVVVAATQKPAADVVPTAIRDLFGYRLALRCATRDASDTVLGAGWAAEGYSAAAIDPVQRGIGYLLAEGGLPRRMRYFLLDDEQLAVVARRAEQLRGTAP